MAARLRQVSLDLMTAGLKARYPDDTEGELSDRLRRLLIGDELFERVYGPRRHP